VVSELRARPGELFGQAAVGLREQREERRSSLRERCEKVAELVAHDRPALVWCQLNDEGNLLEELIPGCVQISGSDSDDAKEAAFLAFMSGERRVLVTKPKIGAWGLNFQHCAHMTFFPAHSYESYYQGVRRCWRFGQTSPVRVDLVTSAGEADVMGNLRRKSEQAEQMFSALTAAMANELSIGRAPRPTKEVEAPAWL
jgi:hypothetical protein